MDSSADDPFAGFVGRESLDYVLFSCKQELVMLVGQADMKASILIGACSLAITGALLGSSTVWPGALYAVAGFSVVSLILAVLSVVPGRMDRAPEDGGNLLFVGHFIHLPPEEFLRRWAVMASSDESLYRDSVRDLWSLGLHLVRSKYRFLRYAYGSFITGTVLAGVLLVLHHLGDFVG